VNRRRRLVIRLGYRCYRRDRVITIPLGSDQAAEKGLVPNSTKRGMCFFAFCWGRNRVKFLGPGECLVAKKCRNDSANSKCSQGRLSSSLQQNTYRHLVEISIFIYLNLLKHIVNQVNLKDNDKAQSVHITHRSGYLRLPSDLTLVRRRFDQDFSPSVPFLNKYCWEVTSASCVRRAWELRWVRKLRSSHHCPNQTCILPWVLWVPRLATLNNGEDSLKGGDGVKTGESYYIIYLQPFTNRPR
jgi:hypothetical protein